MLCRGLLPLVAASLLARSCGAHSWVEQLSLIGDDGSFTGAYGYARGYVARTDPAFNGFSDQWLIPPPETGRTRADASDLLCNPAQRTANQTTGFPALVVSPGAAIAAKYLENGHVSLPQNQKGKPPKAGTVFVYGTTQPRADEKLTDVLQWTADGSGGDGRGSLIASNNFDDDRCYQLNSGAISTQRQQQFPDPVPGQPGSRSEQWCETDIILPSSLASGSYTLYWVWDWPTAPGQDPTYPTGKDEYYTSCADVQVQPGLAAAPVSNKLVQQDPQARAVSNYKSRTAIAPTPSALGPVAGDASSDKPAPVAMASGKAVAPPAGNDLSAFIHSLAPIPVSSASPVVTGRPASRVQVLTALVTVVATLQPGQEGVIVQGQHIVTFVNPDMAGAEPAATVVPAGHVRRHTLADRSARSHALSAL